MKLTKMSALALTFVFGAIASSAIPAYAANKPTGLKANDKNATIQKAVDNCQKRVPANKYFETWMDQWVANYYTLPSDSNKYPIKKTKHLDGQMRDIQSAQTKVTIKSNGKEKVVTRTNYAIVAQRHLAARQVAETQAGMKEKAVFQSYYQSVNELSQSMHFKDLLPSWKSEWSKAGDLNVDCNTSEGRKKAKEQAAKRSEITKEFKKDYSYVKKISARVSVEYKKVAVEYKKTAKASKKR